MSRPPLRGRLKANAVVLLRLINSPSTWKDSPGSSYDDGSISPRNKQPAFMVRRFLFGLPERRAAMRILMVSNDFAGASLARRLLLEVNEVRAFVADPSFERILHGLIPRVPTLDQGLDWIGRDGLAVVDDCGFGAWQDTARKDGFAVVGGSAFGDRLERDPEYAQDLMASLGMPVLPARRFANCPAAARHVAADPRPWVVKFNGAAPKAATFVGELPCGSDAADFLHGCACACNSACNDCGPVLQPGVSGQEIGVGRYFNGREWVGPVELNIEHKRLFPGNLGPNTYEMGTLMWYADSHPLFERVLAPLAPLLRDHGHVGDVDVNCIVNEEGVFPLEITARFGWPATQAQMALHESPWSGFLQSVARGLPVDLRWKPGYAVALFLGLPPFPFAPHADRRGSCAMGLPVRFRRPLTEDESWHLHFESCALQQDAARAAGFVVCDDSGYFAHATGHGPCPDSARRQALDLARLVAVPGIFYREDIGTKGTETIHAVNTLLASLR
jgi:phosphoribosylamine--glycine ligase